MNLFYRSLHQSNRLLALAVDDSRPIRRLMAHSLSQAGCRIIQANDGYVGWQLAERFKPDIIVTDLDMPYWGGWQMIEAIRNSKDYWVRQGRIIVCSRRDDPLGIQEAFDAGADYFFPKPIDQKELRSVVSAVVQDQLSVLKSDG